MNKASRSTRLQLLRNIAVLQIKLLIDGMRDAILIPISLIAGILGLLRGGGDADREFQHVVRLGRRTEQWINVFGHEPAATNSLATGSLDNLLARVEAAVMEQYRKIPTSGKAGSATNTPDEFVEEGSGKEAEE